MKSNFLRFIEYINSKNTGEILSRKEFPKFCNDNYRIQFVHIGFLKGYKRGQYIKCCSIPEDLTTVKCKYMAYEITLEQKLRYIRSIKLKDILDIN